jgi:hypothetical protein
MTALKRLEIIEHRSKDLQRQLDDMYTQLKNKKLDPAFLACLFHGTSGHLSAINGHASLLKEELEKVLGRSDG